MRSPLPDSATLEAGIFEDQQPLRLSRVQDNVRNLLRSSASTPTYPSPLASPKEVQQTCAKNGPRSQLNLRLAREDRDQTTPLPTSTSSNSNPGASRDVLGILFPPLAHRQRVQDMSHRPSLIDTPRDPLLGHPDMSDSSIAALLQQKEENRQKRAWKRSRHPKKHHRSHRDIFSRWALCLVSGLILIAIVATYLVLSTASTGTSSTFHVLFVLGILMSTIVFVHSLAQACIFKRQGKSNVPRVYVLSNDRLKRRQRRHRQHGYRQHEGITSPELADLDYIPPTPIQVHVAADDIGPDSRDGMPLPTNNRPSLHAWNKDIDVLPHPPPPAYGRWRGSVRANPDLLHWQPIPSPIDPETPALPSPTYEEAMSDIHQGPTSESPVCTHQDSPERRREVRTARPELARSQMVEPEVVEERGVRAE
ncbi:hypothetical protein D0867_13090 [Hortaea werneckii]|uniref:Uncharacterized protein n=1 Tax=Hortaea werneckii TaxID=91943 RepID=A0A3M6ZT73_HORWE|nr:hypothetical protein KC334_g10780 [Hortaea werneckii]RMX96578.1 hypothetical protein D0867_13090 [Hortaea werneckii]RMY18506.1 hypothetical protein D0866_13154 [Hortaea werneckii]